MLTPIDQNTGNNGQQETGNPITAHPGLRALLQQQIAIRDGVAPAGTPPPAVMPAGGAQEQTPPPISMATAGMTFPSRPTVTGPSKNESSLYDLQHSKPALENVYHSITSSGWGQNHPVLGKLAGIAGQIPATAADLALSLKGLPVLGNSLSSIGQVMPGTTEQHNAKLAEAQGAVNAEAANAEKGAQAENLQADVPLHNAQAAEVAQRTADQPALDQATVAEHNAQAAALLHPQAKTDFEAWQQQNPNRPIAEWLKAMQQNKPQTPEAQYFSEYEQTHPGSTIAEATKAYKADSQAPQRAPVTNILIPSAEGGYDVQGVKAGGHVAPGAVTTAGMNSLDIGTTQQRNVAAQASLVHDQMPQLLAQIQQDKDILGPISGRWNEFMQGKVGMDNPEMASLRANLLMTSSAVALMHARGRLPENLRQEFDNAINAPKQTAENLTAVLTKIDQWTVANMNAMRGGNQPAQGGAPQAGQPEVWTRGKDGKLVKQ